MAKKEKVEFSLSTIKNNPGTRRQLEGFISEIALSQNKIKSEREAIKDIRDEAKDVLGIPGKILNKLVREHMDAGRAEAEISELELVHELSQVIEGHSQCANP